MRALRVALVAALAAALLPERIQAQEDLSPALRQKILNAVASMEGVEVEDLRIDATQRIPFVFSEQTAIRALVSIPTRFKHHALFFNEAGQRLEFEELRQNEEKAYRARFGKKSLPLIEMLQQGFLKSEDEIDLVLWLQMAEDEIPQSRPDWSESDYVKMTDGERQTLLAILDEELKAAISRVQSEIIPDILRLGYSVTAVDQFSPLIVVRGRVGSIALLEALARVQAIFPDAERFSPQAELSASNFPIDISTQVIGAPDVWGAGYIGSGGTRLAVVEAVEDSTNGSNIDFGNQWLSTSNAGTNNSAIPKSKHATQVAGVITSDRTGFKGVAHGVSLLSAGAPAGGVDNTSTMTSIINWAMSLGARIFNHSYGGSSGGALLAVDIQLDYYARNLARLFVVSAGNNSFNCFTVGGDVPVKSPSKGYNVLTVGNFNDKGTVSWTFDQIDGCSHYRNPFRPGTTIVSDLEKPEVVAPGVNIQSTGLGLSGWVTDSASTTGNSFSAAHVSALAALLVHRRPILELKPEALRAAIIAGALNNIYLPNSTAQQRRLSDRDGAGGIDARGSFSIVDSNRFAYGTWYPSDFPSPPGTCQKFYNIPSVGVGERIKAALVWNSTPSNDYMTDPLNARFNLILHGPQGIISASDGGQGTSLFGSWETVDYIATTAGTYKLCVSKEQFSGTQEFFGIAWFKGYAAE